MKLIKSAILVPVLGLLSTPAFAMDGDAAEGEKVFRKCSACHVVDSDTNRTGPHLQNIFGRKPGSIEGFKYSNAMIAFGEENVWDEETIKAYLANPREVVKGTRMAFAGLKKEDELVNVIAYLRTFSTESEEEAGTEETSTQSQ